MAARGESGKQVVQGLTNVALYTGHAERLAYVGLEGQQPGLP